jgi:amidase
LKKQDFFGGEGGIPGAVKRHKLDAIIAPSPYNMVIHLAAMRGLPMVTLPLGYYPEGTKITKNKTDKLVELAPGIPYVHFLFLLLYLLLLNECSFGLLVTGGAFSEETLIRIAYAFEQLTHVRDQREPYIAPASDLANVLAKADTKIYSQEKHIPQALIALPSEGIEA